MYNFIDVTEVSEESILPSEALKINGEYIENQIREVFGFKGTPIRFVLRQRGDET